MSTGVKAERALPAPPSGAARFARLMLAFGVTIPISLAPLVGKLPVPGLTTILDVFPLNLREGLIAFGAIVASLPAIAVQAYYHTTRPASYRRWIFALVIILVVLILAIYAIYTLVVVQVPYMGGDRYARYVIGDEMKPACVCAKRGKDITECVGPLISFNAAVVEGCFPQRQVQRNKLYLSLPYLAFLACLGAAVGMLTLVNPRRRS